MAANREQLREFIRQSLPDTSDEELAKMEKDGTLVDALGAAWKDRKPQGVETITPEAVSGLTRGIRDYGFEGLSASQRLSTAKMPQIMVERYAKAAAMEASAQQQTGYKPKLKPFNEIANSVYEGTKGGFMWTLDMIDRISQDWVFAVADELISGNTTPNQIWDRVGRVLKGEEQVEFAQLLDRLPPEHKRALAEGLLSAKLSFQNAPLPSFLQGLDPVLESVMPGKTKSEASWENARKVYGFVGDMTLDLSLLAGGAGKALGAGAKAAESATLAKGLTAASYAVDPMRGVQAAAGKGSAAMLREMSKHEKLNSAMRSFIVRGTGVKEFDDTVNLISGIEPMLRDELMLDSSKLHKSLKPFVKEGYNIHVLGEERSIELVKSLAKDVAEGRTTLADLDKSGVFSNFETFGNPRASRDAIERLAKKPGDIEAFGKAVQDYSDIWNHMRDIRIKHGISESALKELGGGVKVKLEKTKAMHREAYRKAYRDAQENARKLLEDTRRTIDQNKLTILEAGERGTKEFMELLRTQSQASIDDFMRSYQNHFSDVVAQSIMDNKALVPAADYLQSLYLSKRFLRGRAKIDPMVVKLEKEIATLEKAVRKNPNFVPHVLSKEGMDAVERFVQRTSPGAKLNPTEASDIVRKWVDEAGRPLSHEEVEDLVRRKLWKYGGQEGPLTSGADVANFKPGPIYKKDHLGKKIIKKIRGDDTRELANLFEVDIPTILVTRSRDTARASAAATYFRELITPESPYVRRSVDDLDEAEKLVWTKLAEVDGGAQVVNMMPDLQNVYVSRRAVRPMLDAVRPFITDPAEHPFFRMIDVMKRWWISYTLPIYPMYHTRNQIGNLHNMFMSGFGMDPRYFKSDAIAYLKAKHLQLLLQKGDLEGAERIRFAVKGFKDGVSGRDLYKVAGRLSVSDSGQLSREVADLFEMSDFASNWRTWTPGSSEFALVKGGRAVGEFIENSDKIALFAANLARGHSFERSAAIAKKFLGNYNSMIMTPAERKYFTRMFPFYRWTRFNIPLQFEQLLFNPMHRYRLTNMKRLYESGIMSDVTGIPLEQPPGIEGGALPAWANGFLKDLGALPTSFDPETGEMSHIALEGLIPSADIGNVLGMLESKDALARYALQISNPVAKMIGEAAFGVPAFGEPIPYEGRSQEFLGQDMPSWLVSILRNLRFLNELDRMDPFAGFVGPNSVWNFHKRRQRLSEEERILKSLTGLGTYKAKPGAGILAKRYDQLEEIAKAQSAARRSLEEKAKMLRQAAEWEEDAAKRQAKEKGE